jgi:hypothetical protein
VEDGLAGPTLIVRQGRWIAVAVRDALRGDRSLTLDMAAPRQGQAVAALLGWALRG